MDAAITTALSLTDASTVDPRAVSLIDRRRVAALSTT